MVFKLFDSDESDGDGEGISKIEINTDFARRYEHNKKREDLQRLEELKNKGLVDDSSDSDSDEIDDDNAIDSKFFDALLKVKNQDPSLKQKEMYLFETSDEDEDIDDGSGDGGKYEDGGIVENRVQKEEKKQKPVYLKDVQAKQLIEGGPEFVEKDEVEKADKPMSYTEEQEELRRAFLDAAGAEEDGEGEFLKLKQREDGDENKDGLGDSEGDKFHKKLDQYFGNGEELDEKSMFLRDYFSRKMWIHKGAGIEGMEGFSEDEEELEKEDDYERVYNFRFEENAGDRVLGHARFVEGMVRKKPVTKKLQRERKKERMTLAEFERREELKHLKNLKMEEIIKKRNMIKKIAGTERDLDCAFNANDLDDDFDPEEHDRMIKDIYDENYYKEVDVDPEFGSGRGEDVGDLEKPCFEKENELLGLPKDWDFYPSGKEFSGMGQRILKQELDVEPKRQEEEGGQKIINTEELGVEEMEEIYKLDYEDTIGDLKTRFKYAKVAGNRYGLKPVELLDMADKELNQYVSLKKIAPYREKEWKVPNSTRYAQKMRNRSLLKGLESDHQNGHKKRQKQDNNFTVSGMKDGAIQLTDSIGDAGCASRKRRKKQRREELKLSMSRLISYGKIPFVPKNRARKKSKVKN